MTPKPALAIVGPTASGKTALALELARRVVGLELVSIDAMAVYRGLDIGTAKPTSEEQRMARWHLIDIAGPSEEFSVATFQRLALDALHDIESRRHRAVLVGGTGLYHRAVIDQLELPPRYVELSNSLAKRALRPGGLEDLYRDLVAFDPLAASRIEPNNERRIVRALEVTLGSGRPFSSFGPGLTNYEPSKHVIVGLQMQRSVLDERLEARLDLQLESGLLDEVRRLDEAPEQLSKTAAQAIGYKELLAHLHGEVSFEAARALILARTRSFARRQESWFRRDPRVIWLDATADDLAELVVRAARW